MQVRTRFAPSPTGFLHVGSARTALFAWAYARRHAGQFILRIEDTDRERSTQASIDAIYQAMDWLGLTYDEGPFLQTARMEYYQAAIEQLLASQQAYRCTCSKERLQQLRDEQLKNKQKPCYDGHCRDANWGADVGEHVIRLRNPEQGVVQFEDAVYGSITIDNATLDDLVLARSDGMPTYNLTVVVDDAAMGITHVIRGDDHLNNTPRQINLYHALGLQLPQFAHVPMILGADGARLSKRHGAVSVLAYRDAGYRSEAILNYLLRLGWSHGDQEIFSKQDMEALFDLEHISRSPASIDPNKLTWLNQQYLKQIPVEELVEDFAYHLKLVGIEPNEQVDLAAIIEMQRERCKTFVEMAEKSRYFFEPVTQIEDKLIAKHLPLTMLEPLKHILTCYTAMQAWEAAAVHEIILQTADQFELKLGKLAQAIRVAITGGTVSPPLDVTLQALGQTVVIQRLQQVIQLIGQ